MRNKLLYFADSYTYLLYYYRLFIVTWIEDFSTNNLSVEEATVSHRIAENSEFMGYILW